MSELKNCPFCGQTPEYTYSESSIKHDSHLIRCIDPGCICNVRPEAEILVDGDIDPSEGHDFVADEWNHRPLEEALEVRVKELEAELAQAQAQVAAVQWITYDGTPETLPKRGRLVVICVADTPRVSCLCMEEDALEWDMEVCTWSVKEGHHWAYLPLPSTISKKNFTK